MPQKLLSLKQLKTQYEIPFTTHFIYFRNRILNDKILMNNTKLLSQNNKYLFKKSVRTNLNFILIL